MSTSRPRHRRANRRRRGTARTVRPPATVLVLLLLAAACGGGGGGEAAPAGETLLSVVAVGDTTGYGIPEGDPLEGVAARIGAPDLFLFNHEGVSRAPGPADAGCVALPGQSLFLSSPAILDALRLGPNPVAGLANNHVLDCGADGLADTRAALALRGFATVGAGDDEADATAPLRLEVNGVRVGVAAFLAQVPDLSAAGPARAGAASFVAHDGAARIAVLAAESDLVIVGLHVHVDEGWTEDASPESVAVIHAALDAGADVVFAHGPHVPRGVIVRDGRVAVASLGNFLFRPDYALSEPARRSLYARVDVEPGALVLTISPLRLDETGRPRIPTAADGREILDALEARSGELGTRLERVAGAARVSVAAPHLFFRGATARR